MVVAYSLIKVESEKNHEIVFVLRSRNQGGERSGPSLRHLRPHCKIVKSPEALEVFIFNVLRKILEVRDTTTLIASRIAAGACLG